jgi:hypothetical protein
MDKVSALYKNKKIVCCCTILLAILFSYFAISKAENIDIKGWKGCRILLVEKSMDNDSIYKKLKESNFFDEVISKYNTEVAYSNYNSLSYITVDKIEKRFHPQDPSLSNFIKKIG